MLLHSREVFFNLCFKGEREITRQMGGRERESLQTHTDTQIGVDVKRMRRKGKATQPNSGGVRESLRAPRDLQCKRAPFWNKCTFLRNSQVLMAQSAWMRAWEGREWRTGIFSHCYIAFTVCSGLGCAMKRETKRLSVVIKEKHSLTKGLKCERKWIKDETLGFHFTKTINILKYKTSLYISYRMKMTY